MAQDNVTRRISIYVNGKEVENSLKSVEGAMSQVRNKMRLLNTDSETYDKDSKELAQTMNQLRERQAAYREELGLTNRTMQQSTEMAGGLKNTLSGIWSSLTSGDLQGAKEGISSLKNGFSGLLSSAKAFVLTPFGATITALAGIAIAVKEWANYNNEVAKANKLTQGITGLVGAELDQVRLKAQALSDVFGTDFKDNLSAAKAIANEFGISYEEALSQIEEGLIKGGASNEEYLDSLREYSTFFAQAGYSVEEFRSIVNAGYDLGIYSDKLPDAIKEFNLAISEQTQATKDALLNSFGEDFTTKLLKGVTDGSISTKEALKLVSEEADRVGLSVQQQQQLTADLFKGAGEDAGGALKIFEAVTKSYEDQVRPLTELEQATKELSDAQLGLAQAQDEALKSDGFAVWQKNAEIAWISVKKLWFDGIKYFTNSNAQLKKMASDAAEASNDAYLNEEYQKNFEDYLNRRRKRLGENFNYEEEALSRIATLKDYYQNSQDKNYKKSLELEIAAIEESSSKQIQLEKTKNAAKEKAAKDNLAIDDKAAKEREKARQKELDAAQKLADQKKALFDKAETEIDALILEHNEKRNLNALSGIDKEIAQVELKYAKDLEKYKEHKDRLAEIEALKSQEINDIKLAKKLEYDAQIDEIDKQLEIDKEAYRLEREAEKATSDEEKQLLLIEKARYLAEQELAAEMEKELAKVENVENAEALKEAIRNKYAQKKVVMDTSFDTAERNIKSQQVDWTKMTEEQKLNATKAALNGAADALNKGSAAWKAVKIAETAIATYQSAVNSYNSLSGIPIVGPVLGGIAAGLAVASGLKQIQAISNTKIEKAPKFFYGGHTGNNAALGTDEYGPVTGYVHKNEYVIPEVMTQDPQFANTIGWLEHNRQRKLKGFVDGGEVSEGVVPGTQNNVQNDNVQLLNAVNTLNAILSRGIFAKVNLGYKDIEEMEDMKNEISSSSDNGTIG